MLVLCNRISHLNLLSDFFRKFGLDFYELQGKTPLGVRTEAIQKIRKSGRGIILATKIFDVGVDIPALNSLVLAGGGKAPITLRQKIGRGLRVKEGENIVHVFDFMNVSAGLLAKHCLERWEVYENEKFEIVPEDNFNELIERIETGRL